MGRSPHRCSEQVKMKYVIKTFLCCNKGKKFTAKQICKFILDNKLSSRDSELNRSSIARLIKSDVYILSDVHIEKKGNLNYYFITARDDVEKEVDMDLVDSIALLTK